MKKRFHELIERINNDAELSSMLAGVELNFDEDTELIVLENKYSRVADKLSNKLNSRIVCTTKATIKNTASIIKI